MDLYRRHVNGDRIKKFFIFFCLTVRIRFGVICVSASAISSLVIGSIIDLLNKRPKI